MPSDVTIQLAKTAEEFEAALLLLQRTREEFGLEKPSGERDKLWLLKHHALPATNTIVALHKGRVVGALCLFGESPFHLPVESHLDLKAFRKNLEGRLAELSIPGFHPDFAQDRNLLFALYHFALCFGTSYCNYDGFVTEAPLAWAKVHAEELHFSRIYEPMEQRQMLFLNARESIDYRACAAKDFHAVYSFPEKKFFLVAHQSMQPSVLNYLFNERTQLFQTISDADLRVLKNVYDWGEYARMLPDRHLNMPEKKTPRFPRFPMNCEGFLVNEEGVQEPVQLLDVSREGLKIRISQVPEKGASYVLTLFVGVNKKTELIANTVWVDKKSAIAGLEIRSSDHNWGLLIEYLEKDYLRVS
ncbi:MAG: PilZ domain-containing protein [Bdellovibrionota bacterium]